MGKNSSPAPGLRFSTVFFPKSLIVSYLNLWSLFKLYFIVDVITVVPIFLPLSPSTQHPHSLRISPHHCSCPWVICISSLATPFSYTLCTVHPHGYSVTIYLYFLIPSPLHPLPHSPSHLAIIKTLSVSMILSLFFLFTYFVS